MRNLLCILIIGIGLYACAEPVKDKEQHILLTVERNYKIPKSEEIDIVVGWQELSKQLVGVRPAHINIVDQHFGDTVRFSFVRQGKKIAQLVLHAKIPSKEAIYTFKIENSKPKTEPNNFIDSLYSVDTRLTLTFLRPFIPIKNNRKSTAQRIAESSIMLYPDVKDFTIISPGKWTYEHGFFLNAVYELSELVDNQSYQSYTRRWADYFLTEDGAFREGVYNMEEYRLDDILPGRLLLNLYQQTKDIRYKTAAETLIAHLINQPKTSEGGYWHKEIYTNQMWLDGIYMADVFATQYARMMDKPEWYDAAVHQIKLMHQKAYDPQTGLYYHGWDEDLNPVWAHPERGHSPEFWSRAIGWYMMALVECLDNLPADYAGRQDIIALLQHLAESVLKYQAASGLWYQVLDKAGQPGNWQETSGTAMFAYAFAKANRLGWLSKQYLDAAQKAYNGILENYLYEDAQGILYLNQTGKVASLNLKNSKGDYDYYINCERRINDYKGLGALLYAALELELRSGDKDNH